MAAYDLKQTTLNGLSLQTPPCCSDHFHISPKSIFQRFSVSAQCTSHFTTKHSILLMKYKSHNPKLATK